jgi:hypothetical protein
VSDKKGTKKSVFNNTIVKHTHAPLFFSYSKMNLLVIVCIFAAQLKGKSNAGEQL